MTPLRFFHLRSSLLVVIAFSWAILTGAISAGYANPFARSGGKFFPVPRMHMLFVVLIPGSSLSDWSSPRYPHLNEIVNQSAVALMNTRTARPNPGEWRESETAAVATLSAGSRCGAPGKPLSFLSAGDIVLPGVTAEELTRRRLAADVQANYVVCPDWASMIDANSSLGYVAQPGNLASSLSGAEVKVVSEGDNWSDLFAAGINGEVTTGINAMLTTAPSIYTVDLGANLKAADMRLAALTDIARRQKADLLLISPFASDADYRHDRRLTPVALWGPNIPPGLLYSYSTHRPGLICNTDIAPTIAAWYGAKLQTAAFGRTQAIAVQPEDAGPETLTSIASASSKQREVMQVLPYFAVLCGIWLAAIALAGIGRGGKLTSWATSLHTAVLLPAAMLALLVSPSIVVLCIAMPLATITGYLMAVRYSARQAIVVVAGILLTIVTVDGLTGSELMQRSTLGYSAIEGARYYGIGNELMGVYLASALVLIDSLYIRGGKAARYTSLALVFGVLAFMGTAGAKAGGIGVTLGMAAAYFYTAAGGKWSAGRIALIPVLGMLVTLFFAFAQMHSGAGEAHLGFSLQRVMSGGWSEVWSIIYRKLAVEARLLWHSAWALPVWIGVAMTAYGRNNGRDTSIRASALMTVALTLLFNDAGAVAAALFLTFILCWRWAVPQGADAGMQMDESRMRHARAAFD